MTFASKVDWWLGALIGAAFCVVTASSLWAYLARGSAISLLPLVLFVAANAACVMPMRYTLNDGELLVRSGMLRWHVPYAAITKIEPSHNPLSSPALSMDRLEISYAGKLLLISPKDTQKFLRELAQRAPLAFDGKRLARAS